MRSIIKYASIAVITVVLLSTLAMIPLTTKAQTYVIKSVTTSRDKWGTIYYNEIVKVDIQLDITSELPSEGKLPVYLIYTKSDGSSTPYAIYAYRVGTTLTFRFWMEILANGALKVYGIVPETGALNTSVDESPEPAITLQEGETITIYAYGVQDSLTFKATPPSSVIENAPTETVILARNLINITVAGWEITAPDLAATPVNPSNPQQPYMDNYTTSNTKSGTLGICIYKEGALDKCTKFNITIYLNETDTNSGVFNITKVVDVNSNDYVSVSKDGSYIWIDASKAGIGVGDTIVFNVTIPKYEGSSEAYYIAQKVKVVSAPTAKITFDRNVIPLGNMLENVTITVKNPSGITNVPVSIQVLNVSDGVEVPMNTTGFIYINGTSCSKNTTLITSNPQYCNVSWTGGTKLVIALSIDTSKLNPHYIGGHLKVIFGSNSSEISFDIFDAKLSINATTLKYGDVLEIKLEDPDLNVNASAYDTITLANKLFEVSGFAPGIPGKIILNETGPNTGVFVGYVEINGTTVPSPDTTIDIKFNDTTSKMATPPTASHFVYRILEVSAVLPSHNGEISASATTVPVNGKIKITIKDPDLNEYPGSYDTVPDDLITFIIGNTQKCLKEINNELKSKGCSPIVFNETGENTGIFTVEIEAWQLYIAFKGVSIPPGTSCTKWAVTNYYDWAKWAVTQDNIVVTYGDNVAPSPGVRLAEFKFISYNASITTDKNYYSEGDFMTITVKDKDANKNPDAKDVITVYVSSTSWSNPKSVPLYETGPDTGVFIGRIKITDDATKILSHGYVYAKLGDQIMISYTDELPADYATTQESKTFVKTVKVGTPTVTGKPLIPQSVSFVNPWTGASITPKVGRLVFVEVPIYNNASSEVTFTALMVVRDSSGAAVYATAVSLTVGAKETTTVSFGWMPTSAGTYTIQVVILKSLTQWKVLGSTLTTTVTVSS